MLLVLIDNLKCTYEILKWPKGSRRLDNVPDTRLFMSTVF